METPERRVASRNPTSTSSRTSRARSTRPSSPMRSTTSGFRDQAMAEHLRPVGSAVKFAGWARTIACIDTYHLDEDPYGTGDRGDRQHPSRGSRRGVDRRIAPQRAMGRAALHGRDRPRRAWRRRRRPRARRRPYPGSRVPALRRRDEAGGLEGARPGRGLQRAGAVRAACSSRRATSCLPIWTASSRFPAAMVDEVVRLATDKVSRENHSRDELKQGAYLRSVYDKYGVL